jgi:hypothetical protein
MRVRAIGAAPVLVLAMLVPREARAFSDPALFAAPAVEGGGAGRYFTGSPADGHGCGVCHYGGASPSVFLDGLPDVPEPFARYDVTVRWDAPDASHAMHLELMNPAGEHPSVELSNADALPPEARCDSEPDGPPAVYAVDVGARRVLGVQDCGARALSFSFVAPAEPVHLALGLVRSDSSATRDGDGVLELRRVIGSGADAGGGCSFRAPSREGDGFILGLCVGLSAFALRRRRRAAWCLLLALPGCFPPDVPSDYVRSDGADEPPVDLFRHEGAGTEDACSGGSPGVTSSLRFRVRTSALGGRFAPRNVGAIWVQDGSGAFVKTLEQWGTTRAKWLLAFNAASGGDVVDAITGPTKLSHESHEVTWDLASAAGCTVAAGDYAVWLETTDKSGAGVTLSIPFVLADPGKDILPEETPTFHDMALTWE